MFPAPFCFFVEITWKLEVDRDGAEDNNKVVAFREEDLFYRVLPIVNYNVLHGFEYRSKCECEKRESTNTYHIFSTLVLRIEEKNRW